MKCLIENCLRTAHVRGWCRTHYERWRAHGNPLTILTGQIPHCTVANCEKKMLARGMCATHYSRWRIHGDPNFRERQWGDGHIDHRGYHYIMHNGKQRLEHTVIAEKALGKPLPKGAEVHHVDFNPDNNRRTNLVVCPNALYHALLHKRTRALGYFK